MDRLGTIERVRELNDEGKKLHEYARAFKLIKCHNIRSGIEYLELAKLTDAVHSTC
jgi:hypothetical protein